MSVVLPSVILSNQPPDSVELHIVLRTVYLPQASISFFGFSDQLEDPQEQLLAHIEQPELDDEQAVLNSTAAQAAWMLLCVQRHLARGPITMADIHS